MESRFSPESLSKASVLDRELESLELSNLAPLEKARLLFLQEQEIFGGYDYFAQSGIEKKSPSTGGDFRHFYLPGNFGIGFDGNGDSHIIREGFDSRHHYFESAERVFIKVDQGGLWIVPRSKHPQLYFSMSECTAVIGYTPERVYAAHIGFSEYQELGPALDLFQRGGVAKENIYVVASVGQTQREANDRATERYSGIYTRPSTIEEYENLSLKDENITAFAFRKGKRLSKDTDLYHSLCRVLATNTFIYNCTNDYAMRYGGFGPEMKLDEEPTNEHIFEIKENSGK